MKNVSCHRSHVSHSLRVSDLSPGAFHTCLLYPATLRSLQMLYLHLHGLADRFTVLSRRSSNITALLTAASAWPYNQELLYYNRTGQFISQIESTHLASRAISSLSFNSSSQLSGSLLFVEWVKNQSSSNIIPFGESNYNECDCE